MIMKHIKNWINKIGEIRTPWKQVLVSVLAAIIAFSLAILFVIAFVAYLPHSIFITVITLILFFLSRWIHRFIYGRRYI